MKIFIWCYSWNLKKKSQPTRSPFLCALASQSIFFPPPNISGKEIKLLQASLSSWLSINYICDLNISFPSFSIHERSFVARLVDLSICLVQERQIYSLGVVCNLQLTYFLPFPYFPHFYFLFLNWEVIMFFSSFSCCYTKLRSLGLKYWSSFSHRDLVSEFYSLVWLIESGLGWICLIGCYTPLLGQFLSTLSSYLLITALVTCTSVCWET